MAAGRTSFWKVFFGVLAALVVVGSCAVGGWFLLRGRAAVGVAEHQQAEHQQQEADYAGKMSVKVDEFKTQRNWNYVRGSVTNRGDKTVSSWKLTIRYLDSSQEVMDTAVTNSTETLRPGESKRFKVMHRDDPRAKSVQTTIEEVGVQ